MPLPLAAHFASPLQTSRLKIRCLSNDDLPALMPLHADAEVMRHLPFEPWTCEADGLAWHERTLARCADGNAVQLVLEADGIVGTAILFAHDAASARAELGYVLRRDVWGQGFGSEAVAALLAHAFGPMQLRRIEAQINPANLASCRLIERMGFTLEGHWRERYTSRGRTYGVNFYGKLSSD